MSPEAQQIAIAEACGWTDIHHAPEGSLRPKPEAWGNPPNIRYASPLPDYLSDLNAMYEAETYLFHLEEHNTYANTLEEIWHPTAAQRAEAFLRALGKWID